MTQDPHPRFPEFRAFVEGSGRTPHLGLVLGSGLADLVAECPILAEAPLNDLVGVTPPFVPGHYHRVRIVLWANVPVIVVLGRYHLYQGLTAEEVGRPVAALADAGLTRLLLTNAAGALNPAYSVGDIMLIEDHLNLPGMAGASPLIPPASGAVDFVPMRGAYASALRAAIERSARAVGLRLQRGVYAFVAGPSYETAAELRMLRLLGGDAVGMSTVPEVVTGRSRGVEVAALSVITNLALPDRDLQPSHDDVLRESRNALERLRTLFNHLLPTIA